MTEEVKKVVLFDIDYTLFNTDLYRDTLYSQLASTLGIAFEEFKIISKEVSTQVKERSGHFDPPLYLALLFKQKRSAITYQQLEDIFWEKATYDASLFKELTRVFETLSEKGFTIGILSTGNDRHQRQKIASIISYFTAEHIHIFVDKISNLSGVLERYKNWKVFLVDDLPEVLSTAKRIDDSITTIWVKSEKKSENTDLINNFKPDRIISQVSQLSHELSFS